MSRFCAAVFLAVACVVPAAATTYLPVSFEELVARADLIFDGEVIEVRPFPLAAGGGTIIKTRVIFRVSESFLGAGSTEILEFLGGEWNGMELIVAGMPRFKEGDRRVMFARRELGVNPVVGFSQGVLRITRDENGIERVLTQEGVPVARPEMIGTSARPATMLVREGMTLSALRTRIYGAIAEARRR